MVVMRLVMFCLFTSALFGSEIRLIYPRLEAGQDTFRYDPALDSTFVLGHVTEFQPSMTLTCEGFPVTLTSDGAFLAFLPIPWEHETFAWNFRLTNGGVATSNISFPFSAMPESAEIDWQKLNEPSWFMVKEKNSHTRTVVGGSYHLFPDSGTVLSVVSTSDAWLKFELADAWTGVIERRFTDSVGAAGSVPEDLHLGDGAVYATDSSFILDFAVSRQALVEVSAAPEGDKLRLTIFDARAAIDRIRYLGHARDIVQDVSWTQRAHGVDLDVHLFEPIASGFRVMATDSRLALEIYERMDKSKSLSGRRIALDPGHGGTADGAIGPRGGEEKDVVLRWSEILEQELRGQGCVVLRTRTDDSNLGLHDRVKLARDFDADIFLSLHGNALPDGENPFVRRGCGTYYYQPLSRGLAQLIQDAILAATGLPDDGVFDANFAVVRPTEFPAVLIEAAYMMHPDEELKLMDDTFLLQLSRGVVKGLREYISTAPAR